MGTEASFPGSATGLDLASVLIPGSTEPNGTAELCSRTGLTEVVGERIVPIGPAWAEAGPGIPPDSHVPEERVWPEGWTPWVPNERTSWS